MAVPKSKVSVSRRGQRRSHDALSSIRISECKATGEPALNHHVTKSADGQIYYKGKVILKAKVKATAAAE